VPGRSLVDTPARSSSANIHPMLYCALLFYLFSFSFCGSFQCSKPVGGPQNSQLSLKIRSSLFPTTTVLREVKMCIKAFSPRRRIPLRPAPGAHVRPVEAPRRICRTTSRRSRK
jgi:hypothetical protein